MTESTEKYPFSETVELTSSNFVAMPNEGLRGDRKEGFGDQIG